MCLPVVFLSFKIVLDTSVSSHFHMNFRIIFSVFAKNSAGILIGITLNLYIILGRIDILTILNFSINEKGMSHHSFRSSLFYFINIL